MVNKLSRISGFKSLLLTASLFSTALMSQADTEFHGAYYLNHKLPEASLVPSERLVTIQPGLISVDLHKARGEVDFNFSDGSLNQLSMHSVNVSRVSGFYFDKTSVGNVAFIEISGNQPLSDAEKLRIEDGVFKNAEVVIQNAVTEIKNEFRIDWGDRPVSIPDKVYFVPASTTYVSQSEAMKTYNSYGQLLKVSQALQNNYTNLEQDFANLQTVNIHYGSVISINAVTINFDNERIHNLTVENEKLNAAISEHELHEAEDRALIGSQQARLNAIESQLSKAANAQVISSTNELAFVPSINTGAYPTPLYGQSGDSANECGGGRGSYLSQGNPVSPPFGQNTTSEGALPSALTAGLLFTTYNSAAVGVGPEAVLERIDGTSDSPKTDIESLFKVAKQVVKRSRLADGSLTSNIELNAAFSKLYTAIAQDFLHDPKLAFSAARYTFNRRAETGEYDQTLIYLIKENMSLFDKETAFAASNFLIRNARGKQFSELRQEMRAKVNSSDFGATARSRRPKNNQSPSYQVPVLEAA